MGRNKKIRMRKNKKRNLKENYMARITDSTGTIVWRDFFLQDFYLSEFIGSEEGFDQ